MQNAHCFVLSTSDVLDVGKKICSYQQEGTCQRLKLLKLFVTTSPQRTCSTVAFGELAEVVRLCCGVAFYAQLQR